MAGLGVRGRAAVIAGTALAVPVGGGLAAVAAGRPDGPVLLAGAVLGAAVTAALASARGLWWLAPAQPMIVVPVAVGGVLLHEPRGTHRSKLGTDALAALQHAFPVALAALGTVLVVGTVKLVVLRARRSGADPDPGPDPGPDPLPNAKPGPDELPSELAGNGAGALS